MYHGQARLNLRCLPMDEEPKPHKHLYVTVLQTDLVAGCQVLFGLFLFNCDQSINVKLIRGNKLTCK